jgi:hypothetical protein
MEKDEAYGQRPVIADSRLDPVNPVIPSKLFFLALHQNLWVD